jgi:hypothetical protein
MITAARALVGLLALAAIAAPNASASLTWGAPVLIDQQPPYPAAAARAQLTGVACPSSKLCVAVDRQGDVVTTRDPAAPEPAWTVTAVDDHSTTASFTSGLSGVSCPSVSLCVAVDRAGYVLTSKHPAAGAAAWKATKLDAGAAPGPVLIAEGLTGVSCPTVRLCIAVDAAGDAFTSHNPSGGRATWRRTRIDPAPSAFGLTGVSCPSAALCVSTSGGNGVIVSADPAARRSAWKLTGATGGGVLEGVSCATRSLCVAIDSGGDALTATHPSGLWRAARISTVPTGLAAISCTRPSLCVAIDRAGNVFVSSNPAAGAATWSPAESDGNPEAFLPIAEPYGVSCASPSLCVAVDYAGDALSSTDPTGGAGGWNVTWVDGSNDLTAVTCAHASCAAVDSAGNVLIPTRPPPRPGAWKKTPIDGTGLSGISCPSPSLCVAVDRAGNVISSRDPRGGAVTWTTAAVEAGTRLSAVSCPSVSLCVAVDAEGNVLTSTDPAGGAGAWSVAHADDTVTTDGGQAALADVSCPSSSLCVAVDDAGNLIASTNPTGGAAAWTVADVDGTATLLGVSCASGSLCVAVDGTNVLTSADPAGGVAEWAATPTRLAPSKVSCPSRSLCVGVDAGGDAVSSSDPADPTARWSKIRIDADPLSDVACASASSCVAVDMFGRVIYGSPARRRRRGGRGS